MNNNARKHHYVPQFYLRQFHCDSDVNKVLALSRHDPFLIEKKNTIKRIGYEDYLYKIKEIEYCIEEKLNKNIETPFSQSSTWSKISNNTPELLTEDDKLTIYIFMRHLESRNIENLEFLKSEHKNLMKNGFTCDYSDFERDMHKNIDIQPNGIEHLYLGMSESIEQYLEGFKNASISIWGSNIPIRTSTNPVINVPIHTFQQATFDSDSTAKWLPLAPNFGAMLFLNKAHCAFSRYKVVEDNVIKTLNRLYLVQLLNSKTTKHMIFNDKHIKNDLNWAGIEIEPKNPRKFKIPT